MANFDETMQGDSRWFAANGGFGTFADESNDDVSTRMDSSTLADEAVDAPVSKASMVGNLWDFHLGYLTNSAISADVAHKFVVSVDTDDQIPDTVSVEDRRWWLTQTPGIVFKHHILGDDRVVCQFRPDKPLDEGRKYFQERGSGTVLACTPKHQERISSGQAAELLIVEGTKQYLAATSHAAANQAVIGILGCHGWSKGKNGGTPGIIQPALTKVATGKRIIVVLDADVSSNEQVYAAARGISDWLDSAGATEVVFAKVPGGKKTGLDDALAEGYGSDSERDAALTRITAKAVPFAKLAKPKASHKGVAAIVSDWERGQVIERQNDEEAVLLGMAVKVLATRTVMASDGSTNAVMLTLQAATGRVGDADRKEYRPTVIRATELVSVAKWKEIITPGSSAGAKAQVADQRRFNDISNAILATADDSVDATHFMLPGMHFDEETQAWVWMGTNGSLTESGLIDTISGGSQERQVGLVDPMTMTEDERRDALRTFMRLTDKEHSPAPSMPFIMMLSHAFSGALANQPQATIFALGNKGSGKSKTLEAMMNMTRGTMALATVMHSNGVASEVGKGLAFSVDVLDDVRPRSSHREEAEQLKTVVGLMRVGLDGSNHYRRRLIRTQDGSYAPEKGDTTARPAIIISGEYVPSGLIPSDRERFFPVKFVPREVEGPNNTKVPTDSSLWTWDSDATFAEWWDAAVTTNKFRAVWAMAIMEALYCANMATEDGEPMFWSSERKEAKVHAKNDLMELAKDDHRVPTAARAFDVAGSINFGVTMFFQMLANAADRLNMGAEFEGYILDRGGEALKAAYTNIIEHWATISTKDSSGMDVLEALRGVERIGSWYIDRSAHPKDDSAGSVGRPGNAKRLGWVIKRKDGTLAVAIIPGALAEVMRGKQAAPYARSLAADGLCEPGKDQKGQVQVRAGGAKAATPHIIIPMDTWEKAGLDGEDEDSVEVIEEEMEF